ncbi:MAG: hypothetical protein QW081_06020, partial [Desulfurococcaceae archaeon]
EELEKLKERRLELYAFEIRSRLKEGDICPVCIYQIRARKRGKVVRILHSRIFKYVKQQNISNDQFYR